MRNISTRTPLEKIIIDFLQKGPVNITDLIGNINKKRKVTKQGVYFCLRGLVQQEMVVVHNKQASLNVRFIKKMKTFFETASQHYIDSPLGGVNLTSLKDGESIQYSFHNPLTTDFFWWDALYTLSESLDSTDPVYLYNPHEWFLLARRESELEAIKEITKKRRFLLTTPGTTVLDKYVAKDFDGNMSQYNMLGKDLFTKNNYYFNVVGDFIIEVWIDTKIANEIDALYVRTKKFNEEAIRELTAIIYKRGKSKLTLSRNKKKAEKLKNLVKKHFYIPASS
jgi:predicted transcriptional regulator